MFNVLFRPKRSALKGEEVEKLKQGRKVTASNSFYSILFALCPSALVTAAKASSFFRKID